MIHPLPATLLIAISALLAGCKSPEERLDRKMQMMEKTMDRQMKMMEKSMDRMEKRMDAAGGKE